MPQRTRHRADPDLPILAGGRVFPSDFGTFHAPNISSDVSAGIGAWTDADLLNAIMRGVSPSGAHLYPAFPFDAYAKATPQDMVDLVAYLRTLPGDPTVSVPHDVGFPFSIRRRWGDGNSCSDLMIWVLADAATPQIERGRYLVEALGHCGECHTPAMHWAALTGRAGWPEPTTRQAKAVFRGSHRAP